MNYLLLIIVFALGLAAPFQPVAAEDEQRPALWIIGDSTVRNGHNGQVGWGEVIGEYFDAEKIVIHNRAIGGRSSRTFRSEGRWKSVLSEMKAGDFLFVQFGHNDVGHIDQRSKYRGSLKGMGYETEIVTRDDEGTELVHAFGWYMRHYAEEAKAKGATVVLFSPVPHKGWNGRELKSDFENYRKWDEQIAQETGVHYIDLTQIVTDAYNLMGPEAVEPLFADARTHTSREGAELNAKAVISGLKGLEGHLFRKLFSAEAGQVRRAQPLRR